MKYVSLFTGIGGLDWGLEQIGAECVAFSEIKESSVRIYSRHYPERRNLKDITTIPPASIPDFDILTGGFPCQSFSIAGKRKGFVDRRGQMIFYIYDILREKKPEFAVLENVKGILTHDNGKTYHNVFKLLSAAGYFVRCIMINSAHHGSAQARERVLFLCRRGLDFPRKELSKTNDSIRFRDIQDKSNDHAFFNEEAAVKLLQGSGRVSLIGGWDKVNTITTDISSSGRARLLTYDHRGFRYLSELEAERLQNFPDNWTLGESRSDRWFALGNAVNCAVSSYIFTKYLKGLWW